MPWMVWWFRVTIYPGNHEILCCVTIFTKWNSLPKIAEYVKLIYYVSLDLRITGNLKGNAYMINEF